MQNIVDVIYYNCFFFIKQFCNANGKYVAPTCGPFHHVNNIGSKLLYEFIL